MRFMPTWLLWIIVIAAAVVGPCLSMLLLFFCAEVLWDATDAIGPPAALSLCIGVILGLVLGKMRSRPAQPSAT